MKYDMRKQCTKIPNEVLDIVALLLLRFQVYILTNLGHLKLTSLLSQYISTFYCMDTTCIGSESVPGKLRELAESTPLRWQGTKDCRQISMGFL